MTTATKEMQATEKGGVKQNYATLRKLLTQKKAAIAKVAGKGMNVERLLQIALLNVRKNPKLMECTQISIVASVLDATMMGIVPGDGTRKGDLIPFYNGAKKRLECQFQPRYGGFIWVAKQGSPELGDVMAKEVYENDVFDYEFGTNKFLKHVPTRGKEKGQITHFYMVVYWTNGATPHFDVMTMEEVEKTRDRAPNYKEAVKHKDPKDDQHWKYKEAMWVRDEVEMGKKTVIKRGLKTIPWANERINKLAELDDRVEAGLSQDTIIELDETEFGTVEDNASKAAAADEAAKKTTQTATLGTPVPAGEDAVMAEWIQSVKEAGTIPALNKVLSDSGKAKLSESAREKIGKAFAAKLAELKARA